MKKYELISNYQIEVNGFTSVEIQAIARDYEELKKMAEENGVNLDDYLINAHEANKTQLGKEQKPYFEFE